MHTLLHFGICSVARTARRFPPRRTSAVLCHRDTAAPVWGRSVHSQWLPIAGSLRCFQRLLFIINGAGVGVSAFLLRSHRVEVLCWVLPQSLRSVAGAVSSIRRGRGCDSEGIAPQDTHLVF